MITFLTKVAIVSGFYMGCAGVVTDKVTYATRPTVYEVQVECERKGRTAERKGLWFKESELRVQDAAVN